MRSRARFTPARDAAGRTVAGQVEDELIWSIGSTTISIVPTATPRTRLYTLTNIYAACVEGDASRRAISTMDIEAIPEAALATCADIEPVFLAEIARAKQPNMVAADALRLFKMQLRPQLVEKVRTIRAKLATPSRY